MFSVSFFSIDPASSEIYTLSLHDALPICFHRSPSSRRWWGRTVRSAPKARREPAQPSRSTPGWPSPPPARYRSEEHTSELQSLRHLVCRLLLEKKKNKQHQHTQINSNEYT